MGDIPLPQEWNIPLCSTCQKTTEQRKNAPLYKKRSIFYDLIITLVAILTSRLRLLAALDTGAFVALSLTDLSEDACLGAASLESLQSAVQGLAFLDVNFGQLLFPSLRYIRLHPGCSLRAIDMTNSGILQYRTKNVNCFLNIF